MQFLELETTHKNLYAILDIETTGGKYNEEGITEIAVYKYDGHEVVDQFITLVNPERDIQPFVVKLTGISNAMLTNAPKFYEIAKRLVEITTDCVIVAHNSSFDYRILKTEFRRLGFDFQKETLCTVELSKKLIPDKPSYSLGKLCKELAIPMSNRHRAEGDALATVKLFKLLIDKDQDKTIIKSAIKLGIEKELSAKLQNILDTLPSEIGVFYVHDAKGEILYIGQANNIKKSVNKLFLRTNPKSLNFQKKLNSVSYELSGNELLGKLKYYNELIQHNPPFNARFNKKNMTTTFSNPNLVLIDKGRNANEKSIVLIENDILFGFGFADLSFQINHIEILKSLLSPIENNKLNRALVKVHLEKKQVQKIIRF